MSKIIATIGPGTQSKEKIRDLIELGVKILKFSLITFVHGVI